MQNLEDLKEKIFFEAKNIIETLSKITTQEELLLKKDLIEELDERISFIKILDKNQNYFISDLSSQDIENQELNPNSENQKYSEFSDDPMEEEVLFTNELNDIHQDNDEIDSEEIFESEVSEIKNEISIQIPELAETMVENPVDVMIEDVEPEEIVISENENIEDEIDSDFDEEYRKNVEEKERELREIEEKRRRIVEFEKEDIVKNPVELEPEDLSAIQEKHEEQARKFKLANIKGLKSVQSLFDEDPLEKLEENEFNEKEKTKVEPTESSLLKTNIPTDFMEAEKPKPEFRLDLNDKIAFSKTLFDGSQSDLNDAIRNLNEFKNLEEAKEYLSDLYYQKNWKKHDDYAQRLWILVENKFL